ncbi:MAG: DUF3160 domain-containing protein [Nibricoccus sp.]
MSQTEYAIANQKWREANARWEAALTPEQLLSHQKLEEEKRRSTEGNIAHALRSRLPLPTDSYDWKQKAASKDIDTATIALLEKQQIAYGPAVKQSFEPYLGGPVYVTSDSLLNAFHVLFEDSYRELEFREAMTLRERLERLLLSAKKVVDKKMLPQKRMEVALQHDQRVLGPAIILLGGSLELFDPALREEISAQAEKIRLASATELPVWLGPPEPHSLIALDYRLCKPVGFYATSKKLSAYFRAVRWLQMIPFRSGHPAEFDAILLLRFAYSESGQAIENEGGKGLLGIPDDLTLEDLRTKYSQLQEKPLDEAAYDSELERLRVTLLRQLITEQRCLINSDLQAQIPLGTLAHQLTFRVLSAARIFDAILFQTLIDQQQKPQGLAVAALLGSTFAEHRLTETDLKTIRRTREMRSAEKDAEYHWWKCPHIYSQYLDALSALFLPPADDAPAFMKREAWDAKSCQTALGGWAQMRHTFTLQAKANALFMGLISVPPGFVEDNPEFFARMARLIDKCHDYFADNKCFDSRELEEAEKPKSGIELFGDANPSTLQQRWLLLSRITHTLEALAQKQPRHQPWTIDEENFLRSYGQSLARVMGYFGNSWLSPHDDAPRWVAVSHDPLRNKSLAAAIGRPRNFYVLYPWNGMQVLCAGSVMQYYEYDSAEQLTDVEWKNLLDSPQTPALPDWLGSGTKPPGTPTTKKRR